MAQKQASIIQPKYWGSATHEHCVDAIDPFDSYLKLYKKQYRKSAKKLSILQEFEQDDVKKDKDGNLIYPKQINFRLKTMNVVNTTINDIIFNDALWSKHFRYKHKNKAYLEKAQYETFRMYYDNMINHNIHQMPHKKYRNKIVLLPITDDISYFIDHELIKQLKELIYLYFGLEIKEIDVSNADNIIFRKNKSNHFITTDIHEKLTSYYQADKDIFSIIGICCKIGIFSKENKVIHSEHNDHTQSAVVSFSKLGIYNKLQRNIPEWLKIRRSGKILLHEIAHLFGLSNCEYFRCLMNKDVVLDCVPMTLCPICLNKLYFASIQHNNHRNTFEPQIPLKLNKNNKGMEGMNDNNDDEKEQKELQQEEEEMVKGGTDEQKEKIRKKRQNLRKIDHETFNLLERYQSLAKWFNDHKLFREATWYKNRLNSLKAVKAVNSENAA